MNALKTFIFIAVFAQISVAHAEVECIPSVSLHYDIAATESALKIDELTGTERSWEETTARADDRAYWSCVDNEDNAEKSIAQERQQYFLDCDSAWEEQDITTGCQFLYFEDGQSQPDGCDAMNCAELEGDPDKVTCTANQGAFRSVLMKCVAFKLKPLPPLVLPDDNKDGGGKDDGDKKRPPKPSRYGNNP